jgi:hypothetical protein
MENNKLVVQEEKKDFKDSFKRLLKKYKLTIASQLWEPKKQPMPFDYPLNSKIPNTELN